jgi:hypothetical protein
MEKPEEERVILMFSGGRDSTLAAVRLHEQNTGITLVTVTSDHLVGIDRVQTRLRELRSIIPPSTKWIHVRQPRQETGPANFNSKTCLPCHKEYVSIAGAILAQNPSRAIAFGYVSYQQQWPEQTPLAIASLKRVLRKHQIELLLPVYSLKTRGDAVLELTRHGLSAEALEQKCLRQVNNIQLDTDQLHDQVGIWENAIDFALSTNPPMKLDVIREIPLSEL